MDKILERHLLILWAVLLAGSAAFGQDFGTNWRDRVSHEFLEEADTLTAAPLTVKLRGGEIYFFDDNIFLNSQNPVSDSIFVTYVGVRVDYAEPHFDASLDAEANYTAYVSTSSASDFEARAFARARFVGPGFRVEAAERFVRESDPFNTNLLVRAARIVSDSIPRAAVALSEEVRAETEAQLQVVRFDSSSLSPLNNFNWRAGGALAFRLPARQDLGIPPDTEALLDGGALGISYFGSSGGPDVAGYYVRGGFRAEPQPQKLFATVLAGYTRADSGSLPGVPGKGFDTADLLVALRWLLREEATVFLDYTRRITFSAVDPFQTTDVFVVRGELKLRDDAKVQARFEYDHTLLPGEAKVEFYSFGVGGEYLLLPFLSASVGVTYRLGGILPPTGGIFYDLIVQVGIAGVY